MINHLAGESVLFILGYGKTFRSTDSFPHSVQALESNSKPSISPARMMPKKKVPPQCRFVVAVYFREENKKKSVGFEHKTTVKDLSEYLSQLQEEKSQDQEGKKAAFGVFLANEGKQRGDDEGEEGFWLKEKRTLVSYGLLDRYSGASPAGPVFSCECEATRSVIWKRKPVHIDASVFPHLLAFKSGKSTPNQPVLLAENTDVFSNRFLFFVFCFFLPHIFLTHHFPESGNS